MLQARQGGKKTHVWFQWEKPEERNLLENLAVDGRVILKWKLKQPDGRV